LLMEVGTADGQVYLSRTRERLTCKAPKGTVGASIYRTARWSGAASATPVLL